MRFDRPLQREPIDLSIDKALLADAQALQVDVSRAAEAGIADAVRKARTELWLEENREALESYNAFVEKNGLPLAKYRLF